MTLRRTPAGLSHGEAPAGEPFLTLRLKPGWQLDGSGNVVRSVLPSAAAGKTRGRAPAPAAAGPAATPLLPAGCRLVPAIPLPGPTRGKVPAAEAELARFVQLRLPPGTSPGEWLERVRGWEFVESAQVPPSAASLP